ncbi:MAG: cysteine desulfurase family protein [Pirellulaceae bacterium]
MRSIFLDYSTTTPIAASVRESMQPFFSELYGHPSSGHWIGRAAAEAIEDARCNLSSLIGCHPSEIVFTSGGTESVNLGLLGVARAISANMTERPHFICSILEHPAVRQTAQQLEREGWDVTVVGCDPYGVVPVDEIERVTRSSTRLVSIMHASHQIGTVQPIAQVAELCHDRDILLHSDAAQTIGKIECQVEELGVDLLSLSGHKFYAPMGIGALFIRLGVPIESILYGEGCEAGLRPGTPNVAAIVGLGQAAKLAQAGLQSAIDRVADFRLRFLQQLESLIGQKLKVHGGDVERVPGILSLELPGVTAEALERKLPEICFGPRAHCNGRQRCPSDNTLVALGLSQTQISNTLRISFGWTTSEDELHRAVHMIAAAYESLVE